MKILRWIVRWTPFGVFAAVAFAASLYLYTLIGFAIIIAALVSSGFALNAMKRADPMAAAGILFVIIFFAVVGILATCGVDVRQGVRRR